MKHKEAKSLEVVDIAIECLNVSSFLHYAVLSCLCVSHSVLSAVSNGNGRICSGQLVSTCVFSEFAAFKEVASPLFFCQNVTIYIFYT